MKVTETLKVAGKSFKHVRQRRDFQVAVYGSKNSFLRIGHPAFIKKEIRIWKNLHAYGFPVPKMLKQGSFQGKYYYIETSLGPKHYGMIFTEETKKYGQITDKTFRSFLALVYKYACAQLQSEVKTKSYFDFKIAIHLKYVLAERPQLAKKVLQKFEEAKRHLAEYPFVLTHGDFNPHNIFPKGVIDYEDLFYGPAGYDLATSIFHIETFPDSPKYEFHRSYKFTPQQKREYLQIFDELYQKKGLPPLSANLKYFEFCRMLWSASRMDSWPKLQKWRYAMMLNRFLP